MSDLLLFHVCMHISTAKSLNSLEIWTLFSKNKVLFARRVTSKISVPCLQWCLLNSQTVSTFIKIYFFKKQQQGSNKRLTITKSSKNIQQEKFMSKIVLD